MGLETEARIGWTQRGTRARMFNATSFGKAGIRVSCSGSGVDIWGGSMSMVLIV